ncbi:hypothetical protein GCM10027442_16010 [Emticicia fontis]
MDILKCQLCIKNDANQKNSLIITKFLINGLFENLPYKGTFIIKHGIKHEYEPQDTIKEYYILCSEFYQYPKYLIELINAILKLNIQLYLLIIFKYKIVTYKKTL